MSARKVSGRNDICEEHDFLREAPHESAAGNLRTLGVWRGMPNKKPVVAHLVVAALPVEVGHLGKL